MNRGRFELIRDGKVLHRHFDKEDKETLAEAYTKAAEEFLGDAKVRLYESQNHHNDWLEAIETRKRPICDFAIGATTVISCHLMNLAYWHDASFRWDPVARNFAAGGDPAWLTRDYRADRADWTV